MIIAELGNVTVASDSPAAPSPDTRYQVLRPHAKGGLGLVSVALDEELKREVAFKEIQEQYADDENGRARFVREAECIQELYSAMLVAIVHTHGTGEDQKMRRCRHVVF